MQTASASAAERLARLAHALERAFVGCATAPSGSKGSGHDVFDHVATFVGEAKPDRAAGGRGGP
jgi:hypothetical protein